ncbi:MAG TPA: DUF6036 family nucleotidyltransferase [Xanthobacteraceae bacterium]|nr:DUF6036 family nucleotidyltransferase [Xanthobacteraceae bacterium]
MRMQKKSIDHILRAASEVTKQTKFVLVGSAAVIARLKHVPLEMMYTPEIDIYAPDADDVELASELIDGNIGQGSQFHNQFGYYGDGVSPETAKMPKDWRVRALEYTSAECPGVVALVPEENDVALAKVVAWRDKDQAWLHEGVRSGILSVRQMAARVDLMPPPNAEAIPPAREVLKQRLRLLAARANIQLPDP